MHIRYYLKVRTFVIFVFSTRWFVNLEIFGIKSGTYKCAITVWPVSHKCWTETHAWLSGQHVICLEIKYLSATISKFNTFQFLSFRVVLSETYRPWNRHKTIATPVPPQKWESCSGRKVNARKYIQTFEC